MKLVVISDTHTMHKKLTIPECDVLIHCGDFTHQGKYWKVKDFLGWFNEQPGKRKVLIAGNHEQTFDRDHGAYNAACRDLACNLYDSIDYLENQELVIDGIKFYGTPWTPWFYDWGFNGIIDRNLPFTHNGSRGLTKVYSEIPKDVQVLICHGPPNQVLDWSERGDERTGSVEMRKLTSGGDLLQLRLYLCGHIHESRGVEVCDGGITFINASSLSRDYETMRQPFIVHLDENGFVDSVEDLNETLSS